jgi:hypothetical protein
MRPILEHSRPGIIKITSTQPHLKAPFPFVTTKQGYKFSFISQSKNAVMLLV